MNGVIPRSRLPLPRAAPPSERTGPDPSMLEGAAAAFRTAVDEQDVPQLRRLTSAYEPVIEELKRSGVTAAQLRPSMADPRTPWTYLTGRALDLSDLVHARVWDEISAARRRNPNAFAQLPATRSAFEERALGRDGARDRDQDVAARGGITAQLAGGAAAAFLDPVTIATLPIGGGGRTVAQTIVREALANAGMEAVQQPALARNRTRMGETLTAGEAAVNIGAAGIAGGVLGGAAKAVEPYAVKAVNAVRARAARGEPVPDGELADAAEAAIGRANMTEAQAGAVNDLRRSGQIDAINPFDATGAGSAAHEARLASALHAVLEERPALPGRAPEAPRPDDAMGRLSPDRTIRFVMNDLEGGAAVVRYGGVDGGTTKWGIAAKFNPGVDVANLTEEQAARIAYRKYWFRELNGAEPRLAAVAFDAGFIGGPKLGKRILRESGGSAARALDLLRAHLNHLADTIPAKARWRKGWNRRVDKMARFIGDSGDRANAPPAVPPLRRDAFSPDQAGELARLDADTEIALDGWLHPGRADDDIPFDLDDVRRGAPAGPKSDPFAWMDDPLPARADTSAARTTDGALAPTMAEAPGRAPDIEAGEPRRLVDDTLDDGDDALPEAMEGSARDTDAPELEDAVPAPVQSGEMVPTAAGIAQARLAPADMGQEARLLRDMWTADAARGRRPAPVYGLRAQGSDDIITFETSYRAIERAQRDPPIAGDYEIVRLHPPEDLRPRAPIAGYNDVEDSGMSMQIESIEHDVRMMVADDPDAEVWLDESGPTRISDMLADLDADEAAIDAARACMAPPKAAGAAA